MKIAYISQSYPPMISGASITVKRLAEGMADCNHKILVMAASDRENAYIQEFKNMRVSRLKSTPNPKRANQRFVRGAFKPIFTELYEFKPDLIHLHDVLTLGICGIYAGRQMGIPVIATIHQLPWFVNAYLPNLPGLKPSVEFCLWKYSRWLNKQCQTMIVPTKTISRTIDLYAGFRTVSISNGVDLRHFSPVSKDPEKDACLVEKYHLDPKLPIILHVGRLDLDKSVDVVIQAVAQVMKRTSTQLLVVGDGECRKKLIELSKRLGIKNKCHFPGFVDAMTDLPGLYRIATVFITASEIETQGLVLLEAMASGLPVVAVDATCIHEVVKHQSNGYLVPPGDTGRLAEALNALLRNPIRAQQMGAASRSIVQAHSIQDSLDNHEKLYHETIIGYRKANKRNSFPPGIISPNDIKKFFENLGKREI